eukprot:15471359-Alexandrium_andersonii.AAC.2
MSAGGSCAGGGTGDPMSTGGHCEPLPLPLPTPCKPMSWSIRSCCIRMHSICCMNPWATAVIWGGSDGPSWSIGTEAFRVTLIGIRSTICSISALACGQETGPALGVLRQLKDVVQGRAFALELERFLHGAEREESRLHRERHRPSEPLGTQE